MKQQLSLFAPALSVSAQHTIREALTLLEGQLREPGESFYLPVMPFAIG